MKEQGWPRMILLSVHGMKRMYEKKGKTKDMTSLALDELARRDLVKSRNE